MSFAWIQPHSSHVETQLSTVLVHSPLITLRRVSVTSRLCPPNHPRPAGQCQSTVYLHGFSYNMCYISIHQVQRGVPCACPGLRAPSICYSTLTIYVVVWSRSRRWRCLPLKMHTYGGVKHFHFFILLVRICLLL